MRCTCCDLIHELKQMQGDVPTITNNNLAFLWCSTKALTGQKGPWRKSGEITKLTLQLCCLNYGKG